MLLKGIDMSDAFTDLIDPALERAASAADAGAFTAVYRQRERLVRAVIAARIGPGTDAVDDLAAEVWARAWTAIRSGVFAPQDGSAGMAGWLSRIARNIAVDHLRILAKARPCTPLDEAPPLAANEAGPEECADLAETEHQARAMLAGLPEGQRRCLELRFVIGLSITETAGVLGLGEGATKALQHRGLARLRRETIGGTNSPAPRDPTA